MQVISNNGQVSLRLNPSDLVLAEQSVSSQEFGWTVSIVSRDDRENRVCIFYTQEFTKSHDLRNTLDTMEALGTDVVGMVTNAFVTGKALYDLRKLRLGVGNIPGEYVLPGPPSRYLADVNYPLSAMAEQVVGLPDYPTELYINKDFLVKLWSDEDFRCEKKLSRFAHRAANLIQRSWYQSPTELGKKILLLWSNNIPELTDLISHD